MSIFIIFSQVCQNHVTITTSATEVKHQSLEIAMGVQNISKFLGRGSESVFPTHGEMQNYFLKISKNFPPTLVNTF